MGKQTVLSVVLSFAIVFGLGPSIGYGAESASRDSADHAIVSQGASSEHSGASDIGSLSGSGGSGNTPGVETLTSSGDEGEGESSDAQRSLDEPDNPEGATYPEHSAGYNELGDSEGPRDRAVQGASEDSEDVEAPEVVFEEGAYCVRSAIDPSFALDVADASVASGANVQVWSANGTNAQRFWLSFDGESYHLQAMCSGKALDVDSGKKENGTNVQQWLLEESNINQAWSIEKNDDGTVTFIAQSNQLALDVSGAEVRNGANVQTWEPNGTPAQCFILEPVAAYQDGVYTLASAIDSGWVVDVPSATQKNGAAAQLWSRNDSPAQKYQIAVDEGGSFSIAPLCSGLFLTDAGSDVVQTADQGDASRWAIAAGAYGVTFVNCATGRALDVDGGIVQNGRRVGTYAINGTRAQGFLGFPTDVLSSGVYCITSAVDGRALDVADGSFSDGANVRVWDSNGTGAQRWWVETAGDGMVTVACAMTNKVLDVLNYGTEPGTNVQVWQPSSGNTAQLFRPIPTGDGYYYLQSACSGLYLDVSGGGGWCGANVQVWTPNETVAQKFRFDQSSYNRSMGDVRSGIDAASGAWGLTSFGGYAPSQAVASQIQAAIDSLRWQGYDLGFVMVDLTTGKGISCNADGTFYSASTIKGPYVAAVCSLYPDSIASWAGTMEPTIRWSSNEGYASLRNAFGPQPMWEWSARSGVSGDIASLRYPWYTARDLAKLWTSNYEYFTTSGGWAASWFTSSSNSALYYQLGSWYTVWSKPGWIAAGGAYNVSNDAGIVWGNGGPYLVAMLSNYPANTARLNDVVWALEAAHNEMMG